MWRSRFSRRASREGPPPARWRASLARISPSAIRGVFRIAPGFIQARQSGLGANPHVIDFIGYYAFCRSGPCPRNPSRPWAAPTGTHTQHRRGADPPRGQPGGYQARRQPGHLTARLMHLAPDAPAHCVAGPAAAADRGSSPGLPRTHSAAEYRVALATPHPRPSRSERAPDRDR